LPTGGGHRVNRSDLAITSDSQSATGELLWTAKYCYVWGLSSKNHNILYRIHSREG